MDVTTPTGRHASDNGAVVAEGAVVGARLATTPLVHQKSIGVAFGLSLVFGPFGYFYVARWWIALLIVIVELIVVVGTLGLAVFILWPVDCVICCVVASNQNKRAIEAANRAHA